MEIIFYIFAPFAILWEIASIKNTDKIIRFKNQFKNKKSENFETTDWSFSILMTGYTIWSIVGVFTSQWILFIMLWIVSLIPLKGKWLIKLDALISLSVLVLIVLNKFHFHVDFTKLF